MFAIAWGRGMTGRDKDLSEKGDLMTKKKKQ